MIRLDYIHAVSSLKRLEKLEDFCKDNGFSFGIFEDGSLYVEETTHDETLWWGRIFENGICETYFYRNDNKHLKPVLMNIFKELVIANEVYFAVDMEVPD